LYGWGFNGSGQLGNNTTSDTLTPAKIGNDFWKSISAGYLFSCGIKTDGSAWSWGFNGNAQLGLGDTQSRSTPTQLGAGFDWERIYAGSSFVYASWTDQSVWSWGFNGFGQLSIGTTQQQSYPTSISTGEQYKMIALAKGSDDGTTLYGHHAVAISADSLTICSVGANYQGQLGIGSTTARYAFECDIFSLAAISEKQENRINIYPNPTSEEFTISLSENIDNMECILSDNTGKEVKRYKLTGIETEINISDIISGIYFIKVGDNTRKIIIE